MNEWCDAHNQDNEVESIPAIPKVVKLLCNNLQQSFYCIDGGKTLIEVLFYCMMLLSHHIMVSRQHNYIYQDADDDKDFEAFALRQ